MKRVLWLSRHPLTAQQADDLKAVVGGDIAVESRNVLWQATADAVADHMANIALWRAMAEQSAIVGGVFPPVAMSALFALIVSEPAIGLTVLSPVSAQDATVRADGSRIIEFRHVRWETIV